MGLHFLTDESKMQKTKSQYYKMQEVNTYKDLLGPPHPHLDRETETQERLSSLPKVPQGISPKAKARS